MTNRNPRADHCGSLIRPVALKKARVEFVHGRLTRDQLVEIEDRAVLDVLAMQRDVGLDIYSDGEFRRGSWLAAISEDFFEGMRNEGIDYVRYPFLRGVKIGDPDVEVPANPIVVGKLKLKRRITDREIVFLKRHAPGQFKITIPSPVTLSRASYRPGVSDHVYPTWTDFFNAYGDLIVGEIRAAVDDGATYIQLDAPHYTRFIVPDRRRQLTDLGIDLAKELDAAVAAENRCLRAARRQGVTVAVHICLGTFILGVQGPLGGAGDYDASILQRLIHDLDADIFLLEYSPRAGSLETLRGTPKGKTISLGVINIRDPHVETRDELLAKIENASKYVSIENLSLCPNCGFSGSAADAWVTEDVQKRKLAVLVDTAREIW
jgi:5-methyltetrahydropteroyltriglutamate--homocysteine methyltransferase